MPIDTNLNVTPYYDDYSEDKNFHRVLFRPGVAVQARELTQLQTILQNQVERFGDNIYKTGTIIRGCSLTTDYGANYIKIGDSQNDGQAVSLSSYANTLVVQEAVNLHSYVVNSVTGLVANDPDLNTLYIKYINTGTGNEKNYSAGQTVKIFNRERTVEDVDIDTGGSSYSNSDTITFSGGGGSGATATITTDASGTITDVSMASKGSGYTTTPNVSITTSTGSSATLTAINYIAEVTVSSLANSVGIGTTVKSSEGVIFQKGHFVRVAPQEIVVEKFSNLPDDKVVGFRTIETISNSNIDSSLLDVATGTPNENAPGANRLKLEPSLTVMASANATTNNEFLVLLEYQNGNIVRDRTSTQFNAVNKELARRTFDESGNYILKPVKLDVEAISSNTTHNNLVVGPVTAYVNGVRAETLNHVRIAQRKGDDFANNTNQTINTSFGNYIIVDELAGTFDIKTGEQILLKDTAEDAVSIGLGTIADPGTTIGNARVRGFEYHSGVVGKPNCQYKLFLYDIKMNASRSFKDVKSVFVATSGVADLVLNTQGQAELKDTDQNKLVFDSGTFAIKELNNEEYLFKAFTNATFTTGGSATLTFSGGNTLPYGTGNLTDANKEEWLVIPHSNVHFLANNTGTVSKTSGSNSVTGSGTSFTSDYTVGDFISIKDSASATDLLEITAITNNEALSVRTDAGTTNASAVASIGFPGNVPIDMTKGSREITINSSTSVTVNLGAGTNVATDFTVHNILQNDSPTVRAKTLNNPVYIKLSTDSLANTTTGPWSLGVPDVLSIEAVYVGTSNTYSETGTNYQDQFELDDGQKDNYYGLSNIKLSPGATLSLTSSSNLLVKAKAFTHGTGKYISTESYPVDDTTTVLPSNKIRTESIPIYVSKQTDLALSLRDSIDCRPIVSNTADVSATTAGAASIDPSNTETFDTNEKFFPSPLRSFTTDIQAYQGRIDRLIVDENGLIRIKEGIPSYAPVPPATEVRTLPLAMIYVAPFPTLSSKEANDAKRPELQNSIKYNSTVRYTMEDIRDIENRLQRVEYYALINTLESNTIAKTLTSDANNQIELFKNGFMVDAMDNYIVSDLNDGEYKAQIDAPTSRLHPQEASVPIDLKYNNGDSSNITKTGNILTLPFSEVTLVNQPIANKQRTLVEDNWAFGGSMQVVPRVDNFFDLDVTGSSTININIADPISQLVRAQNAINRAITQTSSTTTNRSRDLVFQGSGLNDWNAWARDWIGNRPSSTTVHKNTVTTTTRTSFQGITVPPTKSSVNEVGNFLTSVSINPYIRAQKICLYINGLRPGAEHFVFFDNTDISSSCRPGLLPESVTGELSVDDFLETASKTGSQTLTANSTGELAVIVNMPANTFTSGEKEFLVMDFNTLASEDSATSKAIGKFASFGTSGAATALTVNTKDFDLSSGHSFARRTFSQTRTTRREWHSIVVRAWDPLCQTFTVDRQKGSDYLLVSSVELYFQGKDATRGVAIELREVDQETGYPTTLSIPYSRVYKRPADINTSATAATSTKFTFNSPLVLKAGVEYAIVISPDANSPDYRVWTSEPGVPDVTDTSLISNQSWGLGTLFSSTSNRAFSAIQGEDLKFKVNRAEFSSQSGTAVLENGDYEFLTVNVASGSYTGGEDIAQMDHAYIDTALTTNTSSRVITTNNDLTSTLSVNDKVLVIYGTSNSESTANVTVTGVTVTNASSTTTDFSNEYSAGDFIQIGDEVRQVVSIASATSLNVDVAFVSTITNDKHYAVTEKFDVFTVQAANSTSFTVNRPPAYVVNTFNKAVLQKVVTGRMDYYNSSDQKLYLRDSTSANSTHLFEAANSTYLGYLVGDQSEAQSKLFSVDNVKFSKYTPFINNLILPQTTLALDTEVTKSGGGTATEAHLFTEQNVLQCNDTAVVKSRSNEISGTTITKSFTANIQFTATYDDTSPVVDVNPSSILAINYNINNSYANENTRYGNSSCKYISKRLVLEDGLDAEDVKVFVRAYKPSGSDIKVYAKILSSQDPELFEDKDWSPLRQVTDAGVFSSSLNSGDLKEYEFTFKKTPVVSVIAGAATTNATGSNTTINGIGSSYDSELANNDLIKVVYTDDEDDYEVVSVANTPVAGSFEISATLGTASSSASIQKITNKGEAFKYNQNSNEVRYHDSENRAYDGYKHLAIKIVLLSENEYNVPEVDDLRAVAVSV